MASDSRSCQGLTITERRIRRGRVDRRRRRAVGDRAGLRWPEMIDDKGSAVLDDDRQGEEATIVQRGRVDGELRVGFVAGEAPAIASLMF